MGRKVTFAYKFIYEKLMMEVTMGLVMVTDIAAINMVYIRRWQTK